MQHNNLPASSRRTRKITDDPDWLVRKARKLYEKKGYSRRWVNRRIGGISARQELAGEWFRRGAADSEQFRELTNALVRSTFGMDVPTYRQYKRLGRGAKLRDHMSDLELALTSFSETVATEIHRARDTRVMDGLRADVREAGRIMGQTRRQIEKSCGKPVVSPVGQLPSRPEPVERARPEPVEREFSKSASARSVELAKTAKDMHNSTFSPPGKAVA